MAIAIGAQIRQQDKADRIGRLSDFMGAFLGMILVCGILWICYRNAGKLATLLGPSGINIVMRLSAFLLLAMGVQIIWNGLHALIGPLIRQG